MNNVPYSIKKKWREENMNGVLRVCMRADEGNCAGRLTKEHAIYYKGSQVQEEWAILDICAFHHGVDEFQSKNAMNKEKHEWIALNRAPEERLREMSKAENKVLRRERLNKIYGVYSEPRLELQINY